MLIKHMKIPVNSTNSKLGLYLNTHLHKHVNYKIFTSNHKHGWKKNLNYSKNNDWNLEKLFQYDDRFQFVIFRTMLLFYIKLYAYKILSHKLFWKKRRFTYDLLESKSTTGTTLFSKIYECKQNNQLLRETLYTLLLILTITIWNIA